MNKCSSLKRSFTTIGNTPMVRLNDNTYMKLEGHNPSGSIKDRSINNMISNMNRKQLEITPTFLVTSGSAGLALHHTHHKRIVKQDTVVVMPSNYSTKKSPSILLKKKNVKIHNSFKSIQSSQIIDSLPQFRVLLLDDNFVDVMTSTKEFVNKTKCNLLDQHHNMDCVDSHLDTACEIMNQLPDVTDVVCTTGTGGTAAGLIKYLPESVKVHARTSISGEIDGLGDVGRYDNFCDPEMIEDYYKCKYKHTDAVLFQNEINDKKKFHIGESTGVSLWLANEINTDKDKKIVVISADGRII
jgi:cysteine synthase